MTLQEKKELANLYIEQTTLQELYEHREEVRKALRKKAVELSLDTHKADIVMGVGREIRILDELIKEKLSKKDYQQFIETNINKICK